MRKVSLVKIREKVGKLTLLSDGDAIRGKSNEESVQSGAARIKSMTFEGGLCYWPCP